MSPITNNLNGDQFSFSLHQITDGEGEKLAHSYLLLVKEPSLDDKLRSLMEEARSLGLDCQGDLDLATRVQQLEKQVEDRNLRILFSALIMEDESVFLKKHELSCEKRKIASDLLWQIKRLPVLQLLSDSETAEAIRNWFKDEKVSNLVQKVEVLTCLDQKLTRLPLEIASFSALEELRLRNNRIVFLPSCLGRLKALNSLDIRNNPLDQRRELETRLTPEIRKILNLSRLNFLKEEDLTLFRPSKIAREVFQGPPSLQKHLLLEANLDNANHEDS